MSFSLAWTGRTHPHRLGDSSTILVAGAQCLCAHQWHIELLRGFLQLKYIQATKFVCLRPQEQEAPRVGVLTTN